MQRSVPLLLVAVVYVDLAVQQDFYHACVRLLDGQLEWGAFLVALEVQVDVGVFDHAFEDAGVRTPPMVLSDAHEDGLS